MYALSSVYSGTMTMHTHNVNVYNGNVLFIVLYIDIGRKKVKIALAYQLLIC